MAENRRDREKRFYFSRGQLVLLGCAFTLAAMIIFFLGIVVGRGIEERRMARPQEPLIKIPVNPSAQGSDAGPGSQAKEELTFYDTLAKSSNSGSSPEDKASEPIQPERVIKSERKEIKAKGRETPAPVSLRTEERPSAEKAPLSNRVDESGRAWYVQVNAFPDERSGKVSVDRLKNKGYKAYLTEARNKGRLWYRVRVGEFRTREEAERIADILKSKENFPSAFATRQ